MVENELNSSKRSKSVSLRPPRPPCHLQLFETLKNLLFHGRFSWKTRKLKLSFVKLAVLLQKNFCIDHSY